METLYGDINELTLKKNYNFQRNTSSNVYESENILYWVDEEDCSVEIFDKYYRCRFLLTEFKILLIPKIEKNLFDLFQEDHFSISLMSIENIELNTKDKSISYIIIDVEDLRKIKIKLKIEHAQLVYEIIKGIQYTNESDYLNHAIKYKEYILKNNLINNIYILNGYKIYDIEKEYERQGIKNINFIKLSLINKDYKLCETYPEKTYLICNNQINENIYKQCANYRTKNRYPTLCYFHKETNGSLWRSSQNRAGITNENNIYDEFILESIGKISNANTIYGIEKTLFICDARSFISASANRLLGAGCENIKNYKNAEIYFCDIGNIHDVRESFDLFKKVLLANKVNEKVIPLIDNDYSLIFGTGLKNIYKNTNLFSEIEKTNWFKYIYQIINSSILIYTKINLGLSVLVHCSDGWDRCPQLTSLSSLLLDKYYRTLTGFIVLIEKEFISFGHQFKFRLGLCPLNTENYNLNQISPIFIQFLDCVHQLWKEYTNIFEFNLEFLGFIALNLRRGKYGNFFCNSEKERKQKDIYNKTISIWSEILYNKNKYINNQYDEKESQNFKIRDFPYYKIKIWEEYYLKYYKTNKNIDSNHNYKKENIELRKIIAKLIESDKDNINNINNLNEDELKLLFNKDS